MSRKKIQILSQMSLVLFLGAAVHAAEGDSSSGPTAVSAPGSCETLLADEDATGTAANSAKNPKGVKNPKGAKDPKSAKNENSRGRGSRSTQSSRPTNAQTTPKTAKSSQTLGVFPLRDLLRLDDQNPAVKHPFLVANAAEKLAAAMAEMPPRKVVDPVYRTRPAWIHPIFAGESNLTDGRYVVGQEQPLDAVVQYVQSLARGDTGGKVLGLAGNPGTGKTILIYSWLLAQNRLSRVHDKYKLFSYRFIGLEKIPYLRPLFTFFEGEPIEPFFDPDMPRSPFTLLRPDMQKKVLAEVKSRTEAATGVMISKGWTLPEPKSGAILKAIFEYEVPSIKTGERTVDSLSEEEYISILEKYVVVVPKETIRPINTEIPSLIRAQTEDPNWSALFASPNMARSIFYKAPHPFGVDYTGQIFQLDGGIVAFDELFRNPPALLNVLLEVAQNGIVHTDVGEAVKLDGVLIWTANDESIAQARSESALKALIDRSEVHAMRSLLHPRQIEALMPLELGEDRLLMRWLNSNKLEPYVPRDVYPSVNAHGITETATGRVALYYKGPKDKILFAPHALSYISWLAAATRFVTDNDRLQEFKAELNLVSRDPSLYLDAVQRLKVIMGLRSVEPAMRAELSRVSDLMNEGENGISARDIDTWLKAVIEHALRNGLSAITPETVDEVFGRLLDGGTISAKDNQTRMNWQALRTSIKLEILLPALEHDIKVISSGDAGQAERLYASIENDFIALAADPNATEILPEGGGKATIINRDRLERIQKIYREHFGREFSPQFLLSNLQHARRGEGNKKNPELLESVRILISEADQIASTFPSAVLSQYRGERDLDPATAELVKRLEATYPQHGYDKFSFYQALEFVQELRAKKSPKD